VTATLSGTELATGIRAEVTAAAADLTAAGTPPRLAVVVATADESSAWYVRSIARAADAVVVDVGTNPTPDGGLVGDVDAGSVTGRAAGLTPVPGGVGPVTTALLLQHTVASARG
jgi:5,10-methylene-tetrahydrofolate dehydrogenase/methenyl tetrahydrofolate cyclohydrolase